MLYLSLNIMPYRVLFWNFCHKGKEGKIANDPEGPRNRGKFHELPHKSLQIFDELRYSTFYRWLDFYLFVCYYLPTWNKFIHFISLHFYHYNKLENLRDYCRRTGRHFENFLRINLSHFITFIILITILWWKYLPFSVTKRNLWQWCIFQNTDWKMRREHWFPRTGFRTRELVN